MRRLLLVLVALGVVSVAQAQDEAAVRLYSQDIPASELVGLLYREILQQPFVTSPAVQASRMPVTVHISGTQAQARQQAADYLAALGFRINVVEGVHRVEIPQPLTQTAEPTFPMFYDPQWREASALTAYLKPLFPDARFSADPNATQTSAHQVDRLVVHATRRELAQIKTLLPDLDQPVPDLVIKAAVFEVSTTTDDGSGIQLALGLLDGSLSLGIGTAQLAGGGPAALPSSLGSFLSISSSSIEAVVSSLSTDSRFNLVTAPSVRARSGASTSFNVGQSVPVLGAVTYQDRQAVQSVDYRDAGVIFTVRPQVQARVTTIDLEQEISDFVQTTTGVNNTPTLTRRSLATMLSAKDGDVIMLGGLTQSKDSQAREGFSFLPDFMKTNRAGVHRSDLILILQIVRMDLNNPVGSYIAAQSPISPHPERFGVSGIQSTMTVDEAIQRGYGGLF